MSWAVVAQNPNPLPNLLFPEKKNKKKLWSGTVQRPVEVRQERGQAGGLGFIFILVFLKKIKK
jgi:hypothetical protein